jgi:hypothetical protein
MIPVSLSVDRRETINRFLQEQNIRDLYNGYVWPPMANNSDKWKNGFSSIFSLEKDISNAARQHRLTKDHLLQIADWGGLYRQKKRISWTNPDSIHFYENNEPAAWLLDSPGKAIALLDKEITGFGPTYCSKLLHFTVPQVFGALDTRLVQTFGKNAVHYPLLNLKVTKSGSGPSISKYQAGWPGEYGTWIHILNYIADDLNQKNITCPYPEQYETSSLRERGLWLPVDVETALFSYTYHELNRDHDPRHVL